ncbi:Putative acyl-CoA dehydrogenase FadE17 [Zhongshania aliphaticivorans]|uniref:Acyl-CoA dehydrogenase FadE17 n=1 Tax=Zhongshania aliphaticivorans TaxID=1470434 RepID=A0A5S9NCP6_9GAMM|nr:acyl-CoA dehydrogenase family protein [Zhongshania aliphaticivorans]CAA0087253.1 Putative acyl-CoA dehydrogenase FadE17 [Zhongshania aliphaticivorans]CAA0114411.1 Putative acyl-CoA dehydrogenase FadE17 [Zhongshania aliphaticivorans]
MSDLNDFRQIVHAWLEKNCPDSMRTPITRAEQVWAGKNKTFPSDDAKLWFERMRDKGWTVPEWPIDVGGGGLTEAQAKILKDEMKRLGCRTPLFDLGIWMLGPAVLEHGTPEQRQKYLPDIAKGNVRWCQGYSEPGAGSDLASLQTKAEDQGDHFLVNGTKIWTTNADKADWIFCLVRTDPHAKKQEGISFLLIDMDTPGVSTTPIELISGESEFCQTFFDNVKVPKTNLIGELNKGWSVAKSLLKHERKLMSEIGGDTPGPSFSPVQAAIEYIGVDTEGKLQDAGIRDQLVRHEMAFRAVGLTHFRSFEERMHGVADNNVPLIMKYVGTEESKRKEEVLMAILGHRALGWNDTQFTEDELLTNRGWLFSKALSIAGGTSEVQLNIISKRVLGLPDQS